MNTSNASIVHSDIFDRLENSANIDINSRHFSTKNRVLTNHGIMDIENPEKANLFLDADRGDYDQDSVGAFLKRITSTEAYITNPKADKCVGAGDLTGKNMLATKIDQLVACVDVHESIELTIDTKSCSASLVAALSKVFIDAGMDGTQEVDITTSLEEQLSNS